MIKIDDKKWGEFKIDELFVVKRPVARSQVNYDDGNVAFVASSNYNNGVLRYCKPKEKEVLDKGNCITVSPLDASSFYQKNDFLGRGGAGSAIILLYNENLNLYNGLFIASVIRNKLTKYSYNNQLSSSSIIRETIKLPLKNGEPNWKYMEEYMIRIEKFTNKKILFLLSIINREEVHNKNGGGYKKFNLIDLFVPVLAEGDLQAKNLEEGTIPLISSGHINNGVCKYINNQYEKSNLYSGNLITIDMFGKAFYQPKQFYSVSHGRVNILLPKFNLDEDLAIFFVTIFDKIFTKKYAFNEMCSQTALKKEQIFLPIDNNENIDFDFMRKYIKDIKLKIHNKILQTNVA